MSLRVASPRRLHSASPKAGSPWRRPHPGGAGQRLVRVRPLTQQRPGDLRFTRCVRVSLCRHVDVLLPLVLRGCGRYQSGGQHSSAAHLHELRVRPAAACLRRCPVQGVRRLLWHLDPQVQSGVQTHSPQHVCVDCKKNFCSRCFVQLELRPRLCLTCQRFHRTLFDRAELMRLKVKDLLDYLHLHEVPTQTCREKEELVELVLGQRSPSSTSSGGEAVTQRGAPQRRTAAVATPPSPPAPVVLRPRSPEEDQAGVSSDVEENLVPGRRASLSDLSCVRDIEALSVRQLKEILARNFVSYAGCCEKWELMERVTRLFNEHKDLRRLGLYPRCPFHTLICYGHRQLSRHAFDFMRPAHLLRSLTGCPCSPVRAEKAPTQPALEENLCKICMDSPIDCVLLECGHMVTCSKCGKRMNECPICR
ncbi:E3 ubiquitin-protein ligase rififylin-like, partial [Scleropages formosus]